MSGYSIATSHYGYRKIDFDRDVYAVYQFKSITSKWTPVDVAMSESEAISKCNYFEITRGCKTN